MNIREFNIGLNYKDVVLIPKKGILDSRDKADVSCEFLGRKYKLPICPANMKCVIDFKIAEWLSNNGYFYILHRFYDYDQIFQWIKDNQNLPLISISLGVNQKDKDFVDKIFHSGLRVDIITLDISHGYSELMRQMIIDVKSSLDCKIIAGNIWGDCDSVSEVSTWGTDALKVGLAYGKACTTFLKTRVASPMFSSGLEASLHSNIPIIGDGNIRENGDIALGLRAGYDMIMAGSIFAACNDSPAEFGHAFASNAVTDKITRYKLYFGSASFHSKGHSKNVEGALIELPCNGLTYEEKLEEIKQDLSSAVSFLGGTDLSCIRNCEYQVVL